MIEFSSLLSALLYLFLLYLLLVLKQQKSNYPSFFTLLLSDITRYSLLSLARTSNPSYLHLKYNLFLRNIAISSSCKYLNAILTYFIASPCQARYITLLACVSLYASHFFIFTRIAGWLRRFKHRIMSYKALIPSS